MNLTRAILLSGVAACCLATTAVTADPRDRVREMVLAMPSVYSDSAIDLRSDADASQWSSWADHFRDAYEFDRRMQGLSSTPQLNRQLIVGLASEKIIQQYMHSTMGGRAVGDDMFASHFDSFRDRPDFAWFVAAHELEHVLMRRLRAEEPEVPVYIFEGVACSLGDRFVIRSGKNTQYLRNLAVSLRGYTSTQAEDVVANFRIPAAVEEFKATGRLFMGEHVGGLFIEYLAAHSKLSPESFYGHLGEVWLAVGRGERFSAAFQSHLGLSLEGAERDFISFMSATQSDPGRRFAGTVYAGL